MKEWLKNAVLYQIYPTSFYDSNGDGIGDLKGITEKLDYVKDLGVDVIWLNPIFKSPFNDGGYDITDYYAIDERFGSMQDFEDMIAKAKSLGLRICLDLVIGHTSWECEWFKKSSEKEKNKYSDYYIWTSEKSVHYRDKTVSNDFERQGNFYKNYYDSQPALNYGFNISSSGGELESWQMHYTDERLVPLREELFKMIRFWMDKGVSGFRVDMANCLVKNCSNNPSEDNWLFCSDNDKDIEGQKWVWNKIFSQMRKEYPEILFISEWVYPKNSVGKCGFDIDLVAHDFIAWDTLFRYEKDTNLDPYYERGYNYFSEEGKGSVEEFLNEAKDINDFIKGKGYFSAPTGSHDEIRLAFNKSTDQLKVIFAFLLTYKHFPFIYYGDEIGITHKFGIDKDGGLKRTGARTPMQWNDGKNRGFSQSESLYLPTNQDISCSVEAQEKDENSLLNTVKALIKLRKEYSCLGADSEFKVVECENGGYPLIYERKDKDNTIIVVISPSKQTISREIDFKKVLLSSNCEFNESRLTLSNAGFAILLR